MSELGRTIEELCRLGPVAGITVATPNAAGDPIVMHAVYRMHDRTGERVAGVEATVLTRQPDEYRWIARGELSLADIEAQLLLLAWRAGAIDIARTERGPLPAGADAYEPGHGLTVMFSGCPYELCFGGVPQTMDRGEARVDLVEVAAAYGHVAWLYKPGVPREAPLPRVSPLAFRRPRAGQGHQTIYEFR
jgi:hypothetical protein